MNQKLKSMVSFFVIEKENIFICFSSLNRINMDTDTRSSLTPTSSSNAMISPVMNVVSSPSSSPLLPPMSSMINRNHSPIPSSPQPQTPINSNNKKKSSTPSSNPNRFDGTSEEELSKRVLSDILQTNLDIVFVSFIRLFFCLNEFILLFYSGGN